MANSRKGKKKSRPRREHQKKPVQKGIKSRRGQPEMYDELKELVSISITKTAQFGLNKISESLKISRSELIERIGRGLLTITETNPSSNS
jgi:hypothetical protein